jgi:hypothetical protein
VDLRAKKRCSAEERAPPRPPGAGDAIAWLPRCERKEGYGQSAMGGVYAFIARFCSNTTPRAACDSMFRAGSCAMVLVAPWPRPPFPP